LNQRKIIGIYLAAGKSNRFGGNKLVANIHEKPLGAYALEQAVQSNLTHTIVVTQPNCQLAWMTEKVKATAEWTQQQCFTALQGLAHSLKCGLTAAKALNPSAIVVLLADQPLVTYKEINTLINYFSKQPSVVFVGFETNKIISPPMLI